MNFSRQTSCLANLSGLAGLLAFIDAACEEAGLDQEIWFAVRLAGEEACSNIIDHAYRGAEPGPIFLQLRREGAQVVLVVEDRAPYFSPDDAPGPDLSADWEHRRVGGLGWHLIRKMMDEVKHERRPGGGNRLELVKRLAPDNRMKREA